MTGILSESYSTFSCLLDVSLGTHTGVTDDVAFSFDRIEVL